jgi:hypothetical protein
MSLLPRKSQIPNLCLQICHVLQHPEYVCVSVNESAFELMWLRSDVKLSGALLWRGFGIFLPKYLDLWGGGGTSHILSQLSFCSSLANAKGLTILQKFCLRMPSVFLARM